MKRALLLALLVVPAPASAANSVTVGSVASVTGSASVYGQSQQQGLRLAVSRLGRFSHYRLALKSIDDGSNAQRGADAMRTLVAAHAIGVVGPTLSPVAAAADPIAGAAGLPVLASSNTTLDIAPLPTVYRVTLSEKVMIPETVRAARDKLGVKRPALIVDASDGYATGAAAAFQGAGMALTGRFDFDPAAGTLDQAVADALATSPDAVFVAARGATGATALTTIRNLGFTGPIVGGNGFNSPDVLKAAGAAAEGLVCAAPWNAERTGVLSRAFVAGYRKRFGTTPDAFAATAYASVQVLRAAIEEGGGATTRRVRSGLSKLGTLDTVLGRIRFSSAREAQYPTAVQVVRGGAFTLLG